MAQINADEITQLLKEQIQNYDAEIRVDETGTIISLGDGIARIHGLDKAMAGEMLRFPHGVEGLAMNGLGWVIFVAVFLHKLPEGFTVASVMLAGGRGRSTALNSAMFLGATTLAGVLVINLQPSWVHAGLPLSAGVTIYVAATDLVPEVNREPGIRMALVFFAGVAVFFLLRLLSPI